MKKKSLAGLLPDEIKNELKNSTVLENTPAFRSRQIYKWICSGVSSFSEMKNLSSEMRKQLDEKFRVFSSSAGIILKDADKTVKQQVILEDGNKTEAVILSDGKNRKTACLSVQAGCACGCVFCKTGQLGFKRNLEANEIIEEFLHLRNLPEDGRSINNPALKDGVCCLGKEFDSGPIPSLRPEGRGMDPSHTITHIVFMGMGEALLNLENVKKAVEFFSDKEGLNISKRRITLSTCGIVDGINTFTEAGPDIRLAFSLISADENKRKSLVPIASANPLDEIKKSLLAYQIKRKRRITLELVLLKGINTSIEDAKKIAQFSRGLETVINIIPWNPVEGIPYETPPPEETARFTLALEDLNLKVTKRLGKGNSIGGACGQLG